jgi:hypothetical protein
MSKTPFEIRLQLLEMAKDLLQQEYYIKKDIAMASWHAKLDSDKSVPSPQIGEFPTEEQIIEKAKKLNAFVSIS